MTAIAARTTAGPLSASASAEQVAPMLGAMRSRGDTEEYGAAAGIAFGAVRFAWEPPGRRIAPRGSTSAVADATLYYRADLVQALLARGVRDAGGSAAELIAAAYDAFGDDCARHLEGDFAFVVWDEQRRRAFAARDFGGKRTLFYQSTAESLTLASSIGGVAAALGAKRELDLSHLAAVAGGLWGHAPDTCWRGVSELPAGHALIWEQGRGATVLRFWNPPSELSTARETPDDAARHLLDLLTRATDERLATPGATAVTLSGGWDSTAVYGAGQNALRANPGRAIHAVSISYPKGDTGRENEFIEEIAAQWKTTPAWIDIADIGMFADAEASARRREEPFAHPYEAWNRALARTASASGATVVLDGSGGDQLFQTSDVFLADLFSSGRWIELFRQWRARDARGVRAFYRTAVRPALPASLVRWIGRVRRTGTPPHYLERAPSAWFRRAFLREHQVLERDFASRPALPRTSTVLAETHAFMLFPYFARVAGRVASFALSEGVEGRSPLLDARVVDFAARRPWHERSSGRETKILLRRAMQGLLPDSVLAPRARRTGTTSSYFKRSLQEDGRPLIEEMLRNPRLADLGMIDASVLLRAWSHYLSTGNEDLGLRVFFTAQAELWLRTHT